MFFKEPNLITDESKELEVERAKYQYASMLCMLVSQ